MTRKVVQIKGANGAGKTTIMRQLIELNQGEVELLVDESFNKGKPYGTILHDLKIALVGHYPPGSKGGGCDNINKVAWQKESIGRLAEYYPDYMVIAEGAMASTTMTLYNYIIAIDEVPCVVILQVTMDGCLRRLEKRKGLEPGTLTPDSFTQLQPKLDRIPKQPHIVDHVVTMDVEELAEKDMIWDFLVAVGYVHRFITISGML